MFDFYRNKLTWRGRTAGRTDLERTYVVTSKIVNTLRPGKSSATDLYLGNGSLWALSESLCVSDFSTQTDLDAMGKQR